MNENITKQQILYEFWRIYDAYGIKDALTFLHDKNYYNNNIENDYYDNYKDYYVNYTNEITTPNALESMLSDLTLNPT